MTLTIDQLRAWLVEKEREASAAVSARRVEAYEADRDTQQGRHTWDVFTILNARWNVYRELLAAIEKGELPGE